MPQAISSLSGRVGAKHSPFSLRMRIRFPQRMLRPYATPGILGVKHGLASWPIGSDVPRNHQPLLTTPT